MYESLSTFLSPTADVDADDGGGVAERVGHGDAAGLGGRHWAYIDDETSYVIAVHHLHLQQPAPTRCTPCPENRQYSRQCTIEGETEILSSTFEDEMWHCGVDVARTGG